MDQIAKTLMTIRRTGQCMAATRLAAAVVAAGCLLWMPAHADGSSRAWQYDLHDASPSPEDLGRDTADYESYQDWHVLQSPDIALQWSSYVKPAERDLGHARVPGYRKLPGLLASEYWADGRSASQEDGWGRRTALHYTGFASELKPGAAAGGADPERYVFHASFVVWPDGNPDKQHVDVTYHLWVRRDLPFSWAPIVPVTPDVRTRVALGEALADHGLVVRVDRRATRYTVHADGTRSEPATFGEVVWSTDLGPAKAPHGLPPVVAADVADELTKRVADDVEATCESVEKGQAPAAAEVLTPRQRASFVDAMRRSCQRRAARGG